MKKHMKPSDILQGRKTFDIWLTKGQSMKRDGLVSMVLQNTCCQRKSDWKNSVLFKSPADIKKLRNSKGSDIKVWGSSKLAQLLLKHDLVDELWLKIHPLILGKGKKLFDTGAVPAAFKLTEGCITPGGVIIAKNKQAGSKQVLLNLKTIKNEKINCSNKYDT